MVLLGAFLQQELQSNSCCRFRMNQILIFSFLRRALLIFPLTDNPSSFWNFFMAFLVFFCQKLHLPFRIYIQVCSASFELF